MPGLSFSQKQERLANKDSWILLESTSMVSNPNRVRNLRKMWLGSKSKVACVGVLFPCMHTPTSEIVLALSKFLLFHVSLSLLCFRGGGDFTQRATKALLLEFKHLEVWIRLLQDLSRHQHFHMMLVQNITTLSLACFFCPPY